LNVLVTRRIPQAGIDLLTGQGYSLTIPAEDRPLTVDELLAAVRGQDGVLSLLHDRIDATLIEAADKVRVFSNYAVGYNNIDLEACRKKGIRVTNTPGVLTDATADLTWCLLLGAARRVAEADAFLRSGQFKIWSPILLLGADITGKTLGIIGPGRIGRAVAERAQGFRMKVLFTGVADQPELPDWNQELGARKVDLETLLAESDFVTVHTPLDASTHHLIGEAELSRMKRSAILINTARGPIVDEKALVHALKEGIIAGAGLDVYEDEPALAPGLAALPNTVLLPHLGSATIETRDAMARIAARNLIAVLSGEEPPHPVV
jgi:lactate dehydrogenase-like 2-hydroxyacid dehydrogenase